MLESFDISRLSVEVHRTSKVVSNQITLQHYEPVLPTTRSPPTFFVHPSSGLSPPVIFNHRLWLQPTTVHTDAGNLDGAFQTALPSF
jgi:hypothetical protein